MTIVIDLCWYDRLNRWTERNSETAKKIFVGFLLVMSPPALIAGILMMLNVIPSFYDRSGWSLIDDFGTFALVALGFVGSLILFAIVISTLRDLNEKKHWFKIKHCDTEEDCN